MTTVTITEAPLAIEDLLAVVDGARVELDDGTRASIAAGRAVVDRALADGEAVYGLTTQVGHGKDTRLTEEEIQGEQRFLVVSHSGGIGPPLPAAIVRAALAVRLNGIARGGSGAGVRGGGDPGGDAERRRASGRARDGLGRGRRHRADGRHGAGRDRHGPRRVPRRGRFRR